MTRSRVALHLIALVLAGCRSDCATSRSTEEATPAPEPGVPETELPDTPPSETTDVPPWPGCPEGTIQRGEVPPAADETWCERQGVRHGPAMAAADDLLGHRITLHHYREGALHGPYTMWIGGEKAEEGGYLAGERHGMWTSLSLGEVVSRGQYERGQKTGAWIERDVDSFVEPAQWHGDYEVGERHGQWSAMLLEGDVELANGRYRDGEMEGPWIVRHPNGETMFDATFERGTLHGRLEFFGADGGLKGRGDFQRGTGAIEFVGEDGTVERVQRYRDGALVEIEDTRPGTRLEYVATAGDRVFDHVDEVRRILSDRLPEAPNVFVQGNHLVIEVAGSRERAALVEESLARHDAVRFATKRPLARVKRVSPDDAGYTGPLLRIAP